MQKHIQRLVKNVIKTKWTTGRTGADVINVPQLPHWCSKCS